MVRSKFFETAMLYLIKNVQVKFPNGANSWETESPNPNDATVAKTIKLGQRDGNTLSSVNKSDTSQLCVSVSSCS